MKGPLDIHQFLLAHDVHHEIVRLRRQAANADHLAEVLGVAPRRCVALHPYRAGTTSGDVLVVLLASADEPIEDALVILRLSDVLRQKLGDPLLITRARAELVSSITDYLASHLAPLLLPAEVVVIATRGLTDLANAIVYTPTGDGGTALGIRACDLVDLAHASILPEAPVRQRRRPARIDLDQPAAIRLDEPEPTRQPGEVGRGEARPGEPGAGEQRVAAMGSSASGRAVERVAPPGAGASGAPTESNPRIEPGPRVEPKPRDAMRSRESARPRDTPRSHDVARPRDSGLDAVAPRRRARAAAANVRSGSGTPLTPPATAAG